MAESINVEVVYALADVQDLACLSLPEGSTAMHAIEASGLLAKHPEIDMKKNKTGSLCQVGKGGYAVGSDRDRVEIYRPLIADPKEVRKQRAAEGKAMKKVLRRRRRNRIGGSAAVCPRYPLCGLGGAEEDWSLSRIMRFCDSRKTPCDCSRRR